MSKELRDSLGRLHTEKEQLKQILEDLRPSIFQRRLRALTSHLERLREKRRIFMEKNVAAARLHD